MAVVTLPLSFDLFLGAPAKAAIGPPAVVCLTGRCVPLAQLASPFIKVTFDCIAKVFPRLRCEDDAKLLQTSFPKKTQQPTFCVSSCNPQKLLLSYFFPPPLLPLSALSDLYVNPSILHKNANGKATPETNSFRREKFAFFVNHFGSGTIN